MYERMNIEDWKAKKKNDRDAVLADQKQALQEVLQDGTHLTAYLLGRGRLGSGITSGNAALVLKACPQATAVMSFDGWNQFGRRVSKGAVGISQLVRSGGYFTVGKVYDRSATYGNKPCPTVELQGDQLGKAIPVLSALSPVDVQFDDKQPTGFLLTKILFSIQVVQVMKKSLRVCSRILFLPRQRSAMQRSVMKNTCTKWRWLCLLKFVVGSAFHRPPMPPTG